MPHDNQNSFGKFIYNKLKKDNKVDISNKIETDINRNNKSDNSLFKCSNINHNKRKNVRHREKVYCCFSFK